MNAIKVEKGRFVHAGKDIGDRLIMVPIRYRDLKLGQHTIRLTLVQCLLGSLYVAAPLYTPKGGIFKELDFQSQLQNLNGWCVTVGLERIEGAELVLYHPKIIKVEPSHAVLENEQAIVDFERYCDDVEDKYEFGASFAFTTASGIRRSVLGRFKQTVDFDKVDELVANKKCSTLEDIDAFIANLKLLGFKQRVEDILDPGIEHHRWETFSEVKKLLN